MDPRISAGFSILGNALMPDPARLAQASVLRSQMLQNEAATGKLSAETETILRTQENLRLLQDLMANPDSTSNDIISRGIGAGLTNNPADIPRLFLGAEGAEQLDINDPSSFSKALLATGTVASQAATPEGFASDQQRQIAAALAEDITKQRGQTLEHGDRVLDIETDAQTARDVQTMEGDIQVAIADANRDLLAKTEKAKLAHDYYQTTITSRDTNAATAAKAMADAADRDMRASQFRLDRVSEEAMKQADIAGRSRDVDETIAGNLTATDKEVAGRNEAQRIENAGDLAVKQAELGGAGGGDPLVGVSWADRDAAEGYAMAHLAKRLYPAGETTDRATVLRNIDYYTDPVPPDVMQAAIRFGFGVAGEKNPVGAAEIAGEVLQWDPDNERWVLDTGGFPAVAPLPAAGASPLLDSAKKYIARPEGTTPPPVAEAATVPDTTQEAVGDDADGEPFWLSPDGTHYVYANGKPVK